MHTPNAFSWYCRLLLAAVAGSMLTLSVSAQLLPDPKIVSPNSSAIDQFTEVPVDYFTGTPQIEIPLHTLEYGSIKVPIVLRYHPASVMPAQQPGWVGLGWDLRSYGAITRRLRGYNDDLYGNAGTGAAPSTAINSYYPVPGNTFTQSGSDLANVSNWDATSELYADFTSSSFNSAGVNDMQADEFAFNVMGYSGTFYYSGSALGWQVVSNDNIKVTMNGFLSAGSIISAIEQYKQFSGSPCYNCQLPLTSTNQANQFSGFTLTVPDGTQYVFGGQNAMEFDCDYQYAGSSPNELFRFWANTWLLTQIIDPNNHVVNFTYQRTYPTCNLGFSASAFSWTANAGGCSEELASLQNIQTNTHSGLYQWPMYLSSISSPNETISFTIGDATCLRYPDLALQSQSSDGSLVLGPSVQPNDHLWPTLLNGQTSNLRWEQLNNIVITNNLPSGNNNVYRQYVFSYSNSSTQRLTLNGLTEEDNSSAAVKQYTFSYNNIAGLPSAMDGDQTDAWGYYNATPEQGGGVNGASTLKQPNASVLTTGLLTKVIWPTGGNTQFSWQPNDYSQVVTPARNAVSAATSTPVTAGGCRISEITSYNVNSSVLLDKKYYYRRGYTAGSSPSSLISSGILNGSPSFYFNVNNRTDYTGHENVSFWIGSLNSMGAYSYTGEGAFVGYDEVAEVNADGSYIRHFFTSYPADVNGISHYDVLPTGYLGWQSGQDTYFPMSGLDLERGKPIQTLEYTPVNTLVRSTLITYRNDLARFSNFVKLIDLSAIYPCGGGYAVVFTSARKVFSYSYYPTNKKVTTYDQNGKNPVAFSESYAYNTYNLLSTRTTANSKGETVLTTYNYPTDLTDATSTAMTTAHILSPIVKTTTTVGQTVESVNQVIYYSPSTGLYEPQTVQEGLGGNPSETREQYYNYDAYGNPVELSKTNDIHTVYLWSYNGAYPVAKIVGSTYSAVTAIVSQSTLNSTCTPGNDAAVRTLLQSLRTSLPNALITSYTYLPGMGMTSRTDAQGRTTYYEYDNFGRLKAERDFNQNVLKTYGYQFEN